MLLLIFVSLAAAQFDLNGSLDLVVAEKAPLRLSYVSFGASLAPNKRFACGPGYAVKTRDTTRFSFTATRDRLEMSIYPAIFVDVQFPLANLDFSGVRVDLRTQSIDVGMANRRGLLPVAASQAKTFASTFVRDVLSGSAFAARGYNPFVDRSLMQNIAKLQAGLVLPKQRWCAGGPPERLSVNALSSPSVTVSLESQGSFSRHGLVIERGTSLTATINFQGSITTLLDRKPLVDSISFSARTQDGKGGIGVPLFGAKLVLVNGFSLRRGGRVHVEYVSALDALALLGELIANRGVGVNPNREAIGQQMVNEEAEKKIRSWVLANRNNVVPGVDLAQVLGIN